MGVLRFFLSNGSIESQHLQPGNLPEMAMISSDERKTGRQGASGDPEIILSHFPPPRLALNGSAKCRVGRDHSRRVHHRDAQCEKFIDPFLWMPGPRSSVLEFAENYPGDPEGLTLIAHRE